MKSTTLVAGLVLGVCAVGLSGTSSAQMPAPDKLVDALEGTFGKHAARRSGAKGVCATGFLSARQTVEAW